MNNPNPSQLFEVPDLRAACDKPANVVKSKMPEPSVLRSEHLEGFGILAESLAHDLDNKVFCPILLSLDLLRQRCPGAENDERFTLMTQTVQQDAEMVHQVLSIDTGVKERCLEVQMSEVLREIEALVGNTFPKKVQLRLLFPSGLWTVMGDPTQLHDMLFNLCVNARDAMPDGGLLTLMAANVTLDEQEAAQKSGLKGGDYLSIMVEDTGVGMTPEELEKIFDPSYTTKDPGKCIGLGLSAVATIIRGHGGSFQTESSPGRGSIFELYLPALRRQVGPDEETAPGSITRGKGETILLVEDETAVRNVTKKTLETFGYRVLPAAGGHEAIEIFGQRRDEIAAVITDLVMPVLDGAETIRALRNIAPQVRIMAASGGTADSLPTDISALGISHFLPKPYRVQELLSRVREVIAA